MDDYDEDVEQCAQFISGLLLHFTAGEPQYCLDVLDKCEELVRASAEALEGDIH